MKVDLLLVPKISKHHFLRDTEKSFQEIILMGPEPHQFFLFRISQQIWLLEASKFRPIWAVAGRLIEQWPNFFVKFAQICDEQMLKISRRYLLEIFSIFLSRVCANLTKNFLPLLYQPTSHSPFRPKLLMLLATIFVEIF